MKASSAHTKFFRSDGTQVANATRVTLWLRLGRSGAHLALLLSLTSFAAPGALQLLPPSVPPAVFGGTNQSISVSFRNPAQTDYGASVRLRLYQTSSVTAIPLIETPWKTLRVLAGQTIVESVAINCPAVNAETRFLLRWLEATNRLIGTTALLVYPTNILGSLKAFAGEDPPGVFDPQNHLKPQLKALGLELQDLQETSVGDFHGKLAILGPFGSRQQSGESLIAKAKALARKGAAVVWIQPPNDRPRELKPSFYTVLEGKGAVLVVQPGLLNDLPQNPQSQLKLVELCRMALHPQPPQLPGQTSDQ